MVSGTSQVLRLVKSLSAMQETQVRSLGREFPLEEGTAIHSSVLVRRTPWTEEPGGLYTQGCKESDMTEATAQPCPGSL